MRSENETYAISLTEAETILSMPGYEGKTILRWSSLMHCWKVNVITRKGTEDIPLYGKNPITQPHYHEAHEKVQSLLSGNISILSLDEVNSALAKINSSTFAANSTYASSDSSREPTTVIDTYKPMTLNFVAINNSLVSSADSRWIYNDTLISALKLENKMSNALANDSGKTIKTYLLDFRKNPSDGLSHAELIENLEDGGDIKIEGVLTLLDIPFQKTFKLKNEPYSLGDVYKNYIEPIEKNMNELNSISAKMKEAVQTVPTVTVVSEGRRALHNQGTPLEIKSPDEIKQAGLAAIENEIAYHLKFLMHCELKAIAIKCLKFLSSPKIQILDPNQTLESIHLDHESIIKKFLDYIRSLNLKSLNETAEHNYPGTYNLLKSLIEAGEGKSNEVGVSAKMTVTEKLDLLTNETEILNQKAIKQMGSFQQRYGVNFVTAIEKYKAPYSRAFEPRLLNRIKYRNVSFYTEVIYGDYLVENGILVRTDNEEVKFDALLTKEALYHLFFETAENTNDIENVVFIDAPIADLDAIEKTHNESSFTHQLTCLLPPVFVSRHKGKEGVNWLTDDGFTLSFHAPTVLELTQKEMSEAEKVVFQPLMAYFLFMAKQEIVESNFIIAICYFKIAYYLANQKQRFDIENKAYAIKTDASQNKTDRTGVETLVRDCENSQPFEFIFQTIRFKLAVIGKVLTYNNSWIPSLSAVFKLPPINDTELSYVKKIEALVIQLLQLKEENPDKALECHITLLELKTYYSHSYVRKNLYLEIMQAIRNAEENFGERNENRFDR